MPPDVFLKLLLDHVTTPYSSSHPWAHLMVMASMLEGCPTPLLQPHLEQIANTLVQPDVSQNYQQVSSEKCLDLWFIIVFFLPQSYPIKTAHLLWKGKELLFID